MGDHADDLRVICGDQDAAAEAKMFVPFMIGDKVDYRIVQVEFCDSER